MAKKKTKKKSKKKKDPFPVLTFKGKTGIKLPNGRRFFPKTKDGKLYHLDELLSDGTFRDATHDENISNGDYRRIVNSYKSHKTQMKPKSKRKIKVRYKKKSKKKKVTPKPKQEPLRLGKVESDLENATIRIYAKRGEKDILLTREWGRRIWRDDDGNEYSFDKKPGIQIEEYLLQRTILKHGQLEEKIKDPEWIKESKKQAEGYLENIKDVTSAVEKAKIVFAETYQDVREAGLETIDHIREEGDKAIDAIKDEQQDIFERQEILRGHLASDETTQDKLDVLVWYKEASRLVFQAEKEDNEEYYILALDKFAQILETGVANPEALEGMIYTTKKLAYEGYEEDIKQYEKAIAEEKAKQKRPQELLKLNVPDIGQQ